MLKETANKIRSAKSVLLSTHRQCDGDGLGCELAIYFGLKKMGKDVRILNVDETPKKYEFLEPDTHIQYFNGPHDPIAPTDLALIFDTNDRRLVEPLYDTLESACQTIIFVDHHPVLKEGPRPTEGSIVDVKAASTGELAYDLLMELEVPLDRDIAQALYTSIVFDTQLFRYVRNSPRSHEIAAQLLRHETEPSRVHKHLFGNFTANKLRFLAEALKDIEFHHGEKLAVLLLRTSHLTKLGLDIDDSRDVIDMLMNIESVETAALFREDAPGQFKMSLRSKGKYPILDIAENLGGGGHAFASGASVSGDYDSLKETVITKIGKKIAALA